MKTEEELWIDVKRMQETMKRLGSIEQRMMSLMERMEKRWAEEDQRVAKEAPQQEEMASKVVMQSREENPKVPIVVPLFPGTLQTDLYLGEEKEGLSSEELFGFSDVEKKETSKPEGEKQKKVKMDKNADKVFDKMNLKGKGARRKRKKKCIKTKGFKYKCGKCFMHYTVDVTYVTTRFLHRDSFVTMMLGGKRKTKRKKWKRSCHMRTWSMDRRAVKPWLWRSFKKKKKLKEKREREIVWLWQRTGIGILLGRFVIGILELSRIAYSLGICGDKATIDLMFQAIIRWFMWHCWKTKQARHLTNLDHNVVQPQLEDKLKFKERSKTIGIKDERKRVMVLALKQIYSWRRNIIAEHESEQVHMPLLGVKEVVSKKPTLGDIIHQLECPEVGVRKVISSYRMQRGYKSNEYPFLMDMLAGKRVELSARLGSSKRMLFYCSLRDLETALSIVSKIVGESESKIAKERYRFRHKHKKKRKGKWKRETDTDTYANLDSDVHHSVLEDDVFGLLASAYGNCSDSEKECHQGIDDVILKEGNCGMSGTSSNEASFFDECGHEEDTNLCSKRLSCGKERAMVEGTNATKWDGVNSDNNTSILAAEVEQQLLHIGEIHVILLWHLEAGVQIFYDEFGVDHEWTDTELWKVTREDTKMVHMTVDNFEAKAGSYDGFVKSGFNLPYTTILYYSHLYNFVIYKVFGHSPQVTSFKQRRHVVGKLCGKVWTLHQMHHYLLQGDLEKEESEINFQLRVARDEDGTGKKLYPFNVARDATTMFGREKEIGAKAVPCKKHIFLKKDNRVSDDTFKDQSYDEVSDHGDEVSDDEVSDRSLNKEYIKIEGCNKNLDSETKKPKSPMKEHRVMLTMKGRYADYLFYPHLEDKVNFGQRSNDTSRGVTSFLLSI